jgi:RNA polymerase sigma-70 factor (ECF subfamily)
VPDESTAYGVGCAHQRHASPPYETAPSQAWTDEALVQLAQKDDLGAVEQLIRRYQKRVYRIAYHMAYGDAEEAKDFAQEAFFRVFKNIKKFDGRSSFYTWLYRVVVNTCQGQQRRYRRWGKIFFSGRSRRPERAEMAAELENRPAQDAESSPAVVYDARQLRKDMYRVLISLPDKQRLVFQLKVMQEMGIPEIAAVTGLAEGTVKTHLFRATRKAKERLQEWLRE